MSLSEFARHPISKELLHNGQTFQVLLKPEAWIMPIWQTPSLDMETSVLTYTSISQVLGITNYSHWGDAGEMRQCTWADEAVRNRLRDFAVARINKFIHVGSTSLLTQSVEAAGVRQ